MIEEWKDIIGYEGYYQISNMGRVRRIKQYGNTYSGKILQPSLKKKSPNGGYYKHISLSKNNIVRTFTVHRLEVIAFLGLPPTNESVVRHLDGNTLNNIIINLTWGTTQENAYDSIRHGTFVNNTGSRHGNAKLTESTIPDIRRMATTMTRQAIADNFGVARQTIDDVIQGKTWKHV